jgi:5-methylcytosine-specific restriction endonuclease McrA
MKLSRWFDSTHGDHAGHPRWPRGLVLQTSKAEFDPPVRHHGALTERFMNSPFKRAQPGSTPGRPTKFMLNRLVLVLNASYEPVNVCTARRAMKLICKGHAVVEVPSACMVHAGRLDFPLPSVIRLLQYKRVPRFKRSVSRKGILLRDRNTCQYCGAVLPSRDLTLDHVIPRSRRGESVWENLVASCFPCNNRKGSRTPAEAGMALAKPPARVGIHAKHRLLCIDETAWGPYLFM